MPRYTQAPLKPVGDFAMSNPSAPPSLKTQLRKQLLAQRRALAPPRRRSLDALICGQVLQTLTETTHPNQAVAMFQAHGGEPDLRPVMQVLLDSGRKVYLPVLAGQALSFHRFNPACPMQPNRFGILEPADQPSIAVLDLDWVLMPLVGFASNGTRLGMGGGFYDRTFGGLGSDSMGPIKAGVAYAMQQTDALPSEPWDVPMDVIISDRGALWVK